MRKLKLLFIFVLILGACSEKFKGDLIFAEANSDQGFNFPYFLYLPEDLSKKDTYLIVEPNNSGFLDDDLGRHIEKAKRNATRDFYTGNYCASRLGYPLLVPVFPRPKSQSHTYTHALDRDVIMQKNNALERIDLQLIAMIRDAKDRLDAMEIAVHDEILMTGFSASGSFVNRFTMLHPDLVKASAAGGLNGLLMLPLKKIDSLNLIYPVGVWDFENLTGKAFNVEAFKNTPQFLYMGALDDNDAIPFDDAFSEDERQLIYQVLGKEMQAERWSNCKMIYDSLEVDAEIKTYENTGHENPEQVKQEIFHFFRQVSAKKE